MERYNNTIQESNGDIITTATVTVYLSSTGAVASIFADNEVTALNNPFTVSDSNYDTDGSFWFKAANDLYDVKVTNNAVDTWVKDENLFDYADPVSLLFTTITASEDTSAGDNATMGYTATEGLILTGQGSSNDVTIKNDADVTVAKILTGETNMIFASGVSFNGESTSANTLDDYEEGTWTPGTANLTIVGAFTSAGRYIKVGKMIYISGWISAATSITWASSALINGLPFVGTSDNDAGSAVNINANGSKPSADYNPAVQVNAAFSRMFLSNFTAMGAGHVMHLTATYAEA